MNTAENRENPVKFIGNVVENDWKIKLLHEPVISWLNKLMFVLCTIGNWRFCWYLVRSHLLLYFSLIPFLANNLTLLSSRVRDYAC